MGAKELLADAIEKIELGHRNYDLRPDQETDREGKYLVSWTCSDSSTRDEIDHVIQGFFPGLIQKGPNGSLAIKAENNLQATKLFLAITEVFKQISTLKTFDYTVQFGNESDPNHPYARYCTGCRLKSPTTFDALIE